MMPSNSSQPAGIVTLPMSNHIVKRHTAYPYSSRKHCSFHSYCTATASLLHPYSQILLVEWSLLDSRAHQHLNHLFLMAVLHASRAFYLKWLAGESDRPKAIIPLNSNSSVPNNFHYTHTRHVTHGLRQLNILGDTGWSHFLIVWEKYYGGTR